jgi:hypothetical protein
MKPFYSPTEFADALGVPVARVRQWTSRKLIKNVHARPPVEYSAEDLCRMAVLVALAEVYEQPLRVIDASVGTVPAFIAAVKDAKNYYPEHPIVIETPSCAIELKSAVVKALRERLAAARVIGGTAAGQQEERMRR